MSFFHEQKGFVYPNHIETVADLGVKALLFEVAATPKPGLVDRHNSGAHKDMDFYTFVSSALSLRPYFCQATQAGYDFYGGEDGLPALFHMVRPMGVMAEADMYKATGGVNTHKGLVFSLGVILTAIGFMAGKGIPLNLTGIGDISKKLTANLIKNDFREGRSHTAGEKLYACHGITGVRGEAAGGFETVLQVTYPALKRAVDQGLSLNDAGVQSLLETAAVLEDTNVLARHDFETLAYVKGQAVKCLELGGCYRESGKAFIHEMDGDFIKRNISPGGAADLVAIAYFFHFLQTMHSETIYPKGIR